MRPCTITTEQRDKRRMAWVGHGHRSQQVPTLLQDAWVSGE